MQRRIGIAVCQSRTHQLLGLALDVRRVQVPARFEFGETERRIVNEQVNPVAATACAYLVGSVERRRRLRFAPS